MFLEQPRISLSPPVADENLVVDCELLEDCQWLVLPPRVEEGGSSRSSTLDGVVRAEVGRNTLGVL